MTATPIEAAIGRGSLAAAFRPSGGIQAMAYDLALIAAGAALIALGARVAIPLWFSPVPVTGQTFGVLVTAMALGSRRGAAAVAAYLCQGAAGVPVFAGGGAGAAYLLGPTGGYLAGFLVAAWIVGRLAEQGWDRRVGTTIGAMLIGQAAIFACGLAWLARFPLPTDVLAAGLWPFIPGALVKTALAGAALPGAWRVCGRSRCD
jgi:biotin transport system substrate-specific component